MKQSFTIQLQYTDFPGRQFCDYSPVYVGLQKKQDITEETPGDSLEKIFSISVDVNRGKQDEPNFLGPYVFGKTGDKFLYLVWYVKREQQEERFRRAKIKLNVLTWEQINQAISSNQPIKANIQLTDAKGGPVCASLKASHIQWI